MISEPDAVSTRGRSRRGPRHFRTSNAAPPLPGGGPRRARSFATDRGVSRIRTSGPHRARMSVNLRFESTKFHRISHSSEMQVTIQILHACWHIFISFSGTEPSRVGGSANIGLLPHVTQPPPSAGRCCSALRQLKPVLTNYNYSYGLRGQILLADSIPNRNVWPFHENRPRSSICLIRYR